MAQTKRQELGEIAMMSRLTALILAKNRAQKAAMSAEQKYTPMALLQPGQLRSVSGGEGTDSPKGSW
jgi:hypothetical protein